ncbi:hypothetical protein [Polaribacter glomeratus]|uniref:Uncharacterized protein n=1 Tax=Polaribacter glomeratus TaxID=102 RepID=A0A2S7WZI9_9FLAO|nr:hypothetical protein [Polaribacter glomeratus]PQJ82782.1 hypothetical protein BTO16_09415 [Polaribacter glomeratus]TXD65324.1 hypothetical protein ESX12_10895 [Polaribacter glomeratus]
MKHFIADLKISNGLSIAIKPKSIKLNFENFEIILQEYTYNISKRKNIAILTIKGEKNEVYQFCLKKDFNPKELEDQKYDFIPIFLKQLILEAHHRSKMLY